MKKTDTRQLLRDLRAAVMLGQAEAVDLALDELLGFPGVAANDRMEDAFIDNVILPVGQVLKKLESNQLRPLLVNPLAAGRAIGAAAMAYRFVEGKESTQKDLRKPAGDARPDVRAALGRALYEVAETDPEKVLNLGTTWLMGSAPKLRHSALLFLPALAASFGQRIVGLLGPLVADEDYDVRKALVEAMIMLARAGLAEPVLGLLALWGTEAAPNTWVICRVLSASWAAGHPAEAESILWDVIAKTGKTSEVTHAVRALERHGVQIDI
jgi:hypothetical protein